MGDCEVNLGDETIDEARSWRELYRVAMLEMDPEKLKECVEAARISMDQRLAELEKKRRSDSLEERWEIAEALSSLAFWEKFND